MPQVRMFKKRKGKGHQKARKREAREAVQLVDTKARSVAISQYLDMIPARYYLSMDNEFVGETAPGNDPAKIKTTTEIVATAAQAEMDEAKKAAKERAENAPESALAKGEKVAASNAAMSKSQKRKAQKLKTHTKDGEKKPPAIDPKNRRELQEKLHRRIAELKDEKKRMQSDRDRVNTALRKAGPAAPAEAKAKKPEGKPKVASVLDEAEVGKLSFEASAASLPFNATKKRGNKATRLQDDMRRSQIEARKVMKAEKAGHGDELKKELAMEKALKRARGEEVHDDPARLRKAQRRLDVQKKKSTKKWDERVEGVKQGIADQDAKRKENLKKTRGKKQFAAEERKVFKAENEAASKLAATGGTGA